MIITPVFKKKPKPPKAWYLSHCAVVLTCSVPASPRQWQQPANVLKVLRCSHSFGGVFLKCSGSLKGNRRHAVREPQKHLFFFPVIIPIASTPALLNIIPSSKQCNLLFKKCFKAPGVVKLHLDLFSAAEKGAHPPLAGSEFGRLLLAETLQLLGLAAGTPGCLLLPPSRRSHAGCLVSPWGTEPPRWHPVSQVMASSVPAWMGTSGEGSLPPLRSAIQIYSTTG